MGVSVTFCGAAGEVTGSCHLVRAGGYQLLLDCGLIQGNPAAERRNHDPFPFDPVIGIRFTRDGHMPCDEKGFPKAPNSEQMGRILELG